MRPVRARPRHPAAISTALTLALTGCVSVTVGSPSPRALPASAPASIAPSSPPSPSPSPTADPATCRTPLADYRIRVRSTGDVSDQDERVVSSALDLARQHFDVRVPECEPGVVTASVLDRTNDGFAAGTFVHDAPDFRIEVYAGGAAWDETPRGQVPIIMLHEWYHVLQYSFLGCAAPRCHVQVRPIPAWLSEGSAEYAAAQAAQDERLLFYSFIRRYELARAAQVDTPLERIDRAATGADYGLGFAAVELLVRDEGSRSLETFWEEAGSTGRWESAFPDAFGTSPARFYRDFAAYRAGGFAR